MINCIHIFFFLIIKKLVTWLTSVSHASRSLRKSHGKSSTATSRAKWRTDFPEWPGWELSRRAHSYLAPTLWIHLPSLKWMSHDTKGSISFWPYQLTVDSRAHRTTPSRHLLGLAEHPWLLHHNGFEGRARRTGLERPSTLGFCSLSWYP